MYTMRQARDGVELSQEEMAEKLGVSLPTYNRYEREPKRMSVDILLKFSAITGVGLDKLRLED